MLREGTKIAKRGGGGELCHERATKIVEGPSPEKQPNSVRGRERKTWGSSAGKKNENDDNGACDV